MKSGSGRWKLVLMTVLVGSTSAWAQFDVDLSGVEWTPQLSPPVVIGASGCDKDILRVSLSGGIPGNEYEVWDGVLVPNGVFTLDSLGTFPVAPNADGITQADVDDPRKYGLNLIVAIQRSPTIFSEYSAAFILRNPTNLAAPEIATSPLWECGLATGVRGQQAGDEVTLFTAPSTVRFTVPSAFSSFDYMPAGPLGGFGAGETLFAQYQTCKSAQGAAHEVSPRSVPVVVAKWTGAAQLPMPRIVDNSMLPGSSRFQLDGVQNGSTITVKVNRSGMSDVWEGVCAMNPCTASMPSSMAAMEEGDLVDVSQRLCPGTDSSDALLEVRACGDVPAPTLASPPRVGDTAIQLASYAPGATITVYVSQDPNDPQVGLTAIGHAGASPTVNLFRPLDANDRWIVIAQTSQACSALTNGSGYGVLRE